MPQIWHDGTPEHGDRDPREYETTREPSDKKGCLELLVLIGVLCYYVYQILSC